MRVMTQVRWTRAQRPLPALDRPQPTRVTAVVDVEVYGAVVGGANQLRLPDSVTLEAGDIVHLVERADGAVTGRCCYRLVTRVYRGVVTVQPGKGQCGGRHG